LQNIEVMQPKKLEHKMTFSKIIAHPWHGFQIGENAPAELTLFVEIVPVDTENMSLITLRLIKSR